MRYRLITFATLLALLFTACNHSSNKKSTITIPHQTFTINHPLAENAQGVDFKATIEVPVSNNDVNHQIRLSLLSKMCGDYYNNDTNVNRAIEHFYQKHLESWEISYNESSDSTIKYPNWELNKTIKAYNQLGDMICYKAEHYYYEGGAHGLTNTTYHVYDLTTAQELNDRNIYNCNEPQTIEAINSMLEEAYAERCAKDSLLANSKVADPILNNNFTISQDSITYLYNPYEIASYNIGNIELSIAKEDIIPFLDTTTVLYRYWQSKN